MNFRDHVALYWPRSPSERVARLSDLLHNDDERSWHPSPVGEARCRPKNGGVQFGPYKQGLAIRRGTGRAVVATAHKILRIAFAMLRDGQPYRDPQVDHQARTAIRNKARWLPSS